MALQTKTFVFAVSLAVLALGQTYAQETDLPPSGDEVVLGEEDLGERGEVLRNMYRRITPPAMETLVQDVGTVPAAWEEFGPQWDDAAAARKFGTWVVPVALTQVEGATILSDANGRILWRGTNDFARQESSGVVLTGGLVAEGDWPAYEAVREELASRTAAVATSEDERQDGAWFGDRSSPATNGLRFASVAVETNGEVRLGLAWEEDGEVDIFAYAVAHTSSWVVTTWTNDENAVVASTNLVWTPVGAELSGMNSAWEWVGTVAVSNGVAEFTDSGFPAGEGRMRYYAAMHATDTDNDDLNDGWEHFVTHTDPINPDSDNDLLFDGEEVAANLDPNDPDMDGDGLLDGWEVLNGLDPLDPSGDNGPDGDPDGDGFPNALESALGGSAQAAAWSDRQLAYRLLHLQNGASEPGLHVNIEDAWNCEGGTCHVRQNIAATLAVPDLMEWGVFLDITVQGKVEDQNRNFDIVTIEAFTNTFFFEGNENHRGCTMATKTATCRVLVLPNSTVTLRYDTNGSMYHKGAYAAITGVTVAGAIQSRTVSRYPANRWRTDLGVGEEVDLIFPEDMGTAVWRRNGSTTPIGIGTNVRYTAPTETTNVQISISFGGHTLSRAFQVLEPTGVVSAQIQSVTHAPAGIPGAGMHLYPIVIGPTNVSFYRVKCQEVGRDATNCTGWWATHTPLSHINNGADEWFDLDEQNRWPREWDYAELFGTHPWTPQSFGAGHFEWEIPALWKVGATGAVHSLEGWKQEFDTGTNGTITIHKLGKWVSRTIQDEISCN